MILLWSILSSLLKGWSSYIEHPLLKKKQKNSVLAKCFFNSTLFSVLPSLPLSLHTLSNLFISLILSKDIYALWPLSPAALCLCGRLIVFTCPLTWLGADSLTMARSIDNSHCCWCWWRCCRSRYTTLILLGRRTRHIMCLKGCR